MILISTHDAGLQERWSEALPGHPDVQISSGYHDTKQKVSRSRPEIVLFDLQMPDASGIDSIAELSQLDLNTRIIAFSSIPDEDEGLKVIQAGGRGYCNSLTSPMLLAKAIEVVRAGEVWVGRKLILRLIEMYSSNSRLQSNGKVKTNFSELTEREREIAFLVSEGDSNKRIALKLDITERTVKAHLTTVFQKLQVRDRLQLAIRVNEQRLQ